MNMHPVHYAPHHTGHLPLCGAERPARGLLIGTLERDHVTCFPCIDQYEERNATPEQIEALAQARDAIDDAMADVEHQLAKSFALHVIGRAIEDTPWWNVRQQLHLRRIRRDIEAHA